MVVLLLVLGLAECFFGYKMFKVLNVIKGFVTGGLFCALIGLVIGAASAINQITRSTDIYAWLHSGETSVIVGVIIGFLIGGILGALLANALVMLAVFFQSFVIGALFGAVTVVITGEYRLVPIAALITGLLLSIICCILFKHVKIIETALEGAVLCGVALAGFSVSIGIVCAVVLCVAGIIVQQKMQKEEAGNQSGAAPVQTITNPSQVQVTSDSIQTQPIHDSVQVQTLSFASTGSVGNYSTESTVQKDEQKLLVNLFQRDICDEMRYVFPKVNVQKIKYYPLFNENGGWVCSCGNANSNEICTFCGMSKKDIQEKLNFTYLNEHMQQRRQEAEEERNRLKKEKQDKANLQIKKMKEAAKNTAAKIAALVKKVAGKLAASVKKHRKKLLVFGGVAICAIGGFVLFTHNSNCMMRYYLFKADRAGDSFTQYQYYRMALNEKENPESYINMLRISLSNGNIDEAVRLNERTKELYSDNVQYKELEKTLYPTEPYFITEGGNYDRRIAVEIGQSEPEYNQKIYFSLDSQNEHAYQDPLAMNTSGSYTVAAWTTNDFGYTSDRVTCEYTINIEIPDAITASLEAGEYQSIQYVELSQSNGETIYYTTDGTDPNQSAYVYNEPIECGFGVNEIKAVCYSASGEPSDIMDNVYYVSYEDHNARDGFSGYYYDYVCIGSDMRIADKKSGETVDTLRSAGNPNEYQGRLYYIDFDDGRNIKMYADGESSVVVPDANAAQLLIAHDSLYYIDLDWKLIRADVDGANKQLIYDDTTRMTRSNGKIYFYTWDGWFCIDAKDADPIEASDSSSVALYYVDASTYVYSVEGDLHVMQEGRDIVLFEESEQNNTYYTTGLLFGHKVEDNYIHDIWDVSLSNRSVTYVCRDISAHIEYSWANESIVDTEKYTFTYTCMVYNIDTGETISLGEAENWFMADDAYYKDGVRINFAH